jgi:hypothetical protein
MADKEARIGLDLMMEAQAETVLPAGGLISVSVATLDQAAIERSAIRRRKAFPRSCSRQVAWGMAFLLPPVFALPARLKGEAHRTFCVTRAGEWQEGSTLEALIFICHHNLSNLTILVDHNGLQGFGTSAEVASMDPCASLSAAGPCGLVGNVQCGNRPKRIAKRSSGLQPTASRRT